MSHYQHRWADAWGGRLNCLQRGNLSLAHEKPYQARDEFETALTHFPDHPAAIVGLSNILMDIYSEELLPPPAVPGLDLGGVSLNEDSPLVTNASATPVAHKEDRFPPLPSEPLGLGTTRPKAKKTTSTEAFGQPPTSPASALLGPQLPPPHRATSLPLNDRLAARDRAHGLLSGLTKLGSGWNYPEAWLALARAYEESEQVEKARDALWWCVELEDGRGVREWDAVGLGGYIL